MSIERPHTVKCPNCGTESSVIIHDSINVTVDPEKKAKVLDRSLFKFHCQKCGAKSELSYCPLYHDMNEKYMIGVVPDKKAAFEERVPDFGTSMGPKYSMLADGYRFRIVCGISGLIEKIMIFDSKLDDYAIAMMKMLLHSQLKNPKEILFCGANETKLKFVVLYKGSKKDTVISVDRKMYKMATEIVADRKIVKQETQYVDLETIVFALQQEKEKK